VFAKEGIVGINIDVENRTHELWVHIKKLRDKLETLCKETNKVFQPIHMDNRSKEFEELLLDNALLEI
jgi:hypothetical protein